MRRLLLVPLLVVAACGDNLDAGGVGDDDGDDAPADILDELASLDGVTVEEWEPFEPDPEVRYFRLTFTEPVDHDDPGAGTFELRAAIQHRDTAAPMVVYTSGYDIGATARPSEPAALLGANQLSLEYRFYGESRPETIPWPLLRIEQAAADEHDVLTKLATIYRGATIGTGGSKGGEHALEYMYLHPEDMDGVVAYVAPVITDFPDLRYDGILDRIGTDPCRTALRAAAREMLVRRAAMESRAGSLGPYTVVGVAHAVETAIVELEFSFWMTRGVNDCNAVPVAATATDAQLFAFLDETSSPGAYSDEELAWAGTQYIYQDAVELGYPVWNHESLDDLLVYSYEDWTAFLPPGEPVPYDPTHARALAAWVEDEAEHILVIGGEWDPWGAGYPPVAPGRDAYALTVTHGSHWSSGIYSLDTADQSLAIDALDRWTGGDR